MLTINRNFGIEIELKGISMEAGLRALLGSGLSAAMEGYNHEARGHWKLVTDASVHGGFEVVSPILHGEEGLADAINAATALENAGATVDRSCGLHVHFNATDLSVGEIRTIARRYATFERRIDAFMPKSRRDDNNTYCRSTVGIFLNNRRFDEGATSADLMAAQGGRYFKLNLQSLSRHHTIEFRQHSGTVEARKIENWVRFLNAFINQSLRIANGTAQASSQPLHLQPMQSRLTQLLQNENGIAAGDLQNQLNLLPHSLRASISYLRKAGVLVETSRHDGQTFYRIERTAEADDLFSGIDPEQRAFYSRRTTALAA